MLDGERRQLTRDEAVVHLTPKAFDLLVLLTSEAPRVVSKAVLHQRLWPGNFVSDATLVGLIKELRRALGDHDGDAPIIRTAHRVGYAFCHPFEPNGVENRGPRGHWIVLAERRIALHDGENIIGRDPGVDVWIDAPGVSRRHARISIDAEGAVLEDLGSKNGTMLAGQPLRGAVRLGDGARIGFGALRVVYRAPAAATTTIARGGRDRAHQSDFL